MQGKVTRASSTIAEVFKYDGIIEGDIFSIDEARSIRHDALRTAYMIFSYLMEG